MGARGFNTVYTTRTTKLDTADDREWSHVPTGFIPSADLKWFLERLPPEVAQLAMDKDGTLHAVPYKSDIDIASELLEKANALIDGGMRPAEAFWKVLDAWRAQQHNQLPPAV